MGSVWMKTLLPVVPLFDFQVVHLFLRRVEKTCRHCLRVHKDGSRMSGGKAAVRRKSVRWECVPDLPVVKKWTPLKSLAAPWPLSTLGLPVFEDMLRARQARKEVEVFRKCCRIRVRRGSQGALGCEGVTFLWQLTPCRRSGLEMRMVVDRHFPATT